MNRNAEIRLTHRPAHGAGGSSGAPAVVVCHGFIQNRFAFETPERSLLDHLQARGLDVYVLELSVPPDMEPARAAAGLHAYCDEVAPRALARVLERHERVGWLGHSMGGLVGVSLPPEWSERLSALAVIGAPLLPGWPGVRLVQSGMAKAARLLCARGICFPGRSLGARFVRARALLDHRLARYPFQVWSPGSMPRLELEFCLHHAFADDSWGAFADLLELGATRGERAGRVDVGRRLARLSRPLLVIGADRDGLAPLAATQPLFERAGSLDKRFIEVSARTTGTPFGHLDLLVGARAPAYVWPHLSRFFDEHLVTEDRRGGAPRGATAPASGAPPPRAGSSAATEAAPPGDAGA